MRIAYCTNVRLPSERAHGHQVAQVCDALVALGHSVKIFAPYRRNVVTENFHEYYGASPAITIAHLNTFDPIASPLLPGVLGLWKLNSQMRRTLTERLKTETFDLLYTRSPALLSPLLTSGMPTVLELHQLPRRGRASFVKQCNRCVRVVCLTSQMRDALASWGVVQERLSVEGDAVDLKRFTSLPAQKDARKTFKVQTERIVVGYVGRLKTLGMEKGVSLLLAALKDQQERGAFFGLIVGGPERDKDHYMKEAKKLGLTSADIAFTGELPATQVPAALAACDILAMPFPDLPHYRLHMSPLKMFEYMAAVRPIITSDLPTIRDVLSHENAVLFPPDQLEGFVAGLRWIAEHPAEAQARAERARELVEHHTWEERMKRILSSIPQAV